MVKRGKFNQDYSNKIVFILTIMVILIVATSTWVVLNKLSDVSVNSQPKVVSITKIIEEGAPAGGAVGLTILQSPKEEGIE